ncbi:hypothetical protein CB1_001616027 [Camelus ferus]|nr:hypothetical protein CB1_001616027 [Camelus ferus]
MVPCLEWTSAALPVSFVSSRVVSRNPRNQLPSYHTIPELVVSCVSACKVCAFWDFIVGNALKSPVTRLPPAPPPLLCEQLEDRRKRQGLRRQLCPGPVLPASLCVVPWPWERSALLGGGTGASGCDLARGLGTFPPEPPAEAGADCALGPRHLLSLQAHASTPPSPPPGRWEDQWEDRRALRPLAEPALPNTHTHPRRGEGMRQHQDLQEKLPSCLCLTPICHMLADQSSPPACTDRAGQHRVPLKARA